MAFLPETVSFVFLYFAKYLKDALESQHGQKAKVPPLLTATFSDRPI
jgi:hypothetical protein